MKIAIDAMGGDRAPTETIKGAVMAAEEYGVEIVLVGKQKIIEAELAKYKTVGLPLSIVAAKSEVEMHEHPVAAVKSKPDSSIVVGMDLLKRRQVDAFISAGNSGAMVASALLTLGRIAGIDRPAIGSILPTFNNKTLLLDIGATTDCKPHYLAQFALMGSLYMEAALRTRKPTVALLSNGEEVTKGNQLIQEASQILHRTNLNFVGNIEGKDLPRGTVDVVVTDGFVGNVVLKLGEGLSEALVQMIREEINRDFFSRLAAFMLLPALRRLRRRMDYSEYGGAPLLGVNGICIIAHGRSNAKAIKSAVRVARQAAEEDLVELIRTGIQSCPKGDMHVQRNTNDPQVTG